MGIWDIIYSGMFNLIICIFRNVGIVEFASHSDMQRAIDRLDDSELMGRRIKLIDDYNRLLLLTHAYLLQISCATRNELLSF